MMAPGTASSITTEAPTGSSRRWTAGRKCTPGSRNTCRRRTHPQERASMCTMISLKAHVSGSGKGKDGWFHVTQANVGYDHTTHAQVEHALLLDFVNPALGPS